jgi:pimeloyl-ACP methyl ester carboxylesterase
VDHTYWDSMVPDLGSGSPFTRWTVAAGGGAVIPTDNHIRREFEDVAALIDHISGPVDVVAHSYGALCTLEAALLTTRIRRMVLYEPPIHTTVEVSYPEGVLNRYNRYLSAGEPEKALLMVYEAGQMSADELDALRPIPAGGRDFRRRPHPP